MRQIVTGSIATDHLMVFPGRFTEQLIEGQLDKVSLSFLVDELKIHRGGIGANVAFGMGVLGLRPVLVGSVGTDFGEYRQWLEEHNVETRHVQVCDDLHTARFLCTTDADNNQIASFYAGAMNQARHIDLRAVIESHDDAGIVIICPDDPGAMLRHTQACRDSGVSFAADPSQQIARMAGPDLRDLVDGATYLFTNEYERELLIRKTGWTPQQVLSRVGTWVTTTGAKGAFLESSAEPAIPVEAAVPRCVADPTGVGDAFRAGFLTGIARGLGHERSAQMGCVMATLVLETTGTQEYQYEADGFLDRLGQSYGAHAAAEVAVGLGLSSSGTATASPIADSAARAS
jgi:adenosine kinase